MSTYSTIGWTNTTWNPVTGCTKASIGCKNCYAERMARRLQAMGKPKYRNGFKPTVHWKALGLPLELKKPRMIFVNSMGDLFHKKVPLKFIQSAFEVMNQADRHVFQILTKRSERLKELSHELKWTPNIWMGVTVENAQYKFRIDDLRKTSADVKFISFEPLLAPVGNLNLQGIDWVIVGGESGPGHRYMEADWVREIKEQCVEAGIKFFFKQWSGFSKKKVGKIFEGRIWNEMPSFSKKGNL